MRHATTRIYSCVVMLLALVLMIGAPSKASGETIALQPLANRTGVFASLDGAETDAPITLLSRSQLGTKDDIAGLQGIWLAGFAAGPESAPTMLSLVWSQDTSGWFPTWSMQLQSDAGLFADGLTTQRGRGFLDGSNYLNLGSVTPQPGHIIESRLSYNPTTGRLDISVFDLTDNTRITARTFAFKPYHGTLYPRTGSVGKTNGMQVERLQSFPYSVPLGIAWEVMMREGATYERLVLTRFTSNHSLALRVGANPQSLAGQYTFTIEDGKTARTLFEVSAGSRPDPVILPFAATELPLGPATLDFRYVDEGGNSWSLGTTRVHIVAANLRVTFGSLAIKGNALQGSVTVVSQDETVRDLPLKLYATTKKVGEESRPGAPRLVFDRRIDRVSTQPTVISFTIPIDTAEPVFSLTLDAVIDLEVGIAATGNQYYVWQ